MAAHIVTGDHSQRPWKRLEPGGDFVALLLPAVFPQPRPRGVERAAELPAPTHGGLHPG